MRNNSYMCDGCNKRVNVEINAETSDGYDAGRFRTISIAIMIAAIYDTITTSNPPNQG